MSKWRVRLAVITVVMVSLGAIVWSWTAATERNLAYTGYGIISGPLLLEWALSPAVTTPGQILTLNATLTNRTKLTHTPAVTLRLPSSLSLLPERGLPAGVTVNMQTNELSWLPVVSANGGVQSLSLVLRVEAADILDPEQAVTAVLSNEGDERSGDALLWIGIPPQIQDVLARSQVAVGQPVQLTAELAGSGPISQHWDLGDGRRVTVNDPVIVYPAAGIYTVILQATNPLATVSRQANITIVPHPAAQFTVDDDNPGIGQPITFANQSGGQPPLTYAWDLGDGTTADVLNPSHQYSSPGIYQVRLTVQNSFGQSEAFWTVRVGDIPIADMVIADSAAAGQQVVGQAFGDDSVTSFRWDMGDGRIYEGEQISHVYGRQGDYYVALQASNEYGQQEIGRWIHIGPGLLATYLPLVARDEVAVSQPLTIEQFDDGSDLVLEPVELSEPFVLEPVELPANLLPAEELFFYINWTREHFGLLPLDNQVTLNTIAQQHVDDMAFRSFTAHIGSDGSSPADRFLLYGYPNGYAGEATAWGFANAHEAVEFWINSPAHRRIILNRYATEVGVGFIVDYSAPNIWYWSAEFGNAFTAPPTPQLRLQLPLPHLPPADGEPAADSLISEAVTYRWNWPQPLTAEQQFVLYLHGSTDSIVLTTTQQASNGSLYSLDMPAYPAVTIAGLYEWQIQLESANRSVIVASERRPIQFAADPNLIPTATATLTPTLAPTPTPTPTSTPTPVPWPTATPPPPVPTQPSLPVATVIPEP